MAYNAKFVFNWKICSLIVINLIVFFSGTFITNYVNQLYFSLIIVLVGGIIILNTRTIFYKKLIMIIGVTFVISVNALISENYLSIINFISGILCLYFLIHFKSKNFHKSISSTFFLCAISQIIVAILSSNFEFPFAKYYYEHGTIRSVFLFNEPIIAGIIYALCFYKAKDFFTKCIFILATLSTLSMFAIAYLFFCYIVKIRLNFISIVFGLVTIFASTYFIGDTIYTRFMNIISFSDGSSNIRIAVAVAQIQLLSDNLFFGTGYGATQNLKDYFGFASSSYWMEEVKSQSVILEIVTSFGLFGTIGLMLTLIPLFRVLFYRSRRLGFLLLILFACSGSLFIVPILLVLTHVSYNNVNSNKLLKNASNQVSTIN